jgi:4-hydroxybenzoate polyprenyltransferase
LNARPSLGSLHSGLAIARYHILLIAMTATLVFGWLATGSYPWTIALVTGLDWFLINLLNRATDVGEDLANKIPGTDLVARRKRAIELGSLLAIAGSLAALHLAWPFLTPFRVLVHAIGLGYSYRLVPTPRGLARFKEIYFLKNFMSAVLFVLTCVAYPIAAAPDNRVMPWPALAALVLFFVPFELTYEILYDLRDLEGDRAHAIPTYPVVHGPERARQIVDALLLGSGAAIAVALAAGAIGLREGLMAAAPVAQLLVYRPRYRRGLTSKDAILITHAGTALLVVYLAGTAGWVALGLPANVYLGLLTMR